MCHTIASLATTALNLSISASLILTVLPPPGFTYFDCHVCRIPPAVAKSGFIEESGQNEIPAAMFRGARLLEMYYHTIIPG